MPSVSAARETVTVNRCSENSFEGEFPRAFDVDGSNGAFVVFITRHVSQRSGAMGHQPHVGMSCSRIG